jgi:rhamnulose-1-phosphate aldolase/alcohol dehydrogenase
MRNSWEQAPVAELDQLVYQSRLVGAEESLVLWGGGNNSVKAGSTDLLGKPIDVMYVKSSGSDMKSIVPSQYPAVRLDYIAPLRSRREEMSDEEMVAYLERCLVDPAGKRPSIETLLHAFLPPRAVLHTHADAILAITNSRGREATVRECFGGAVITVPYRRPGFLLSREVAEAFDARPDAVGIVLMNHGLLTWGATVEEAYSRHIALVTEAENFTARARQPRSATPSVAFKAAGIAPILRGALSRRHPVVLEFDSSDEVLEFLGTVAPDDLAARGAATPDHLLHTKRFPLVVSDPTAAGIAAAVDRYEERCRAAHRTHPTGFDLLDPTPRVALVPGVGMWTAGADARGARIIRDIYRHTIRIITAAGAVGGYETLSDDDAFHGEYWPLELYKLTLAPPSKELAGKVALVTGAASGIGRAIAERLGSEGAHVVVTDIDTSAADEVATGITGRNGLRRAIGVGLDVASEESVERAFEHAVMTYGGIDIVISNAGVSSFGRLDTLPVADWDRSFLVNTRGHFLVSRAALRVMKQQKTGGSIVFNASKNVTAPGKEFGAYSVSKAAEAQLCRIVALEGGELGIRANMLNPDAIFEGSRFWSEEMRSMRARTYGVEASALPEFYKGRTLLNVEVTAADVAEAALFLAGPRSSRTTGAMLPVDGGVKEAFPR